MIDLDKSAVIEKCDRSGMLKLIESFPDQCRHAASIGRAFRLPRDFVNPVRKKISNGVKDYANIVFTGLGGSAIGADLARSYLSGEARVPFFVNRNYTLPAFVGKSSLVIASSYSGDTEETLSAYRDAKSKGAVIIAVTSGGALQKTASSDGFPVLTIPKGYPPRCALGYSFFPLVFILSKLGVVKDKSNQIDEAIRDIKDLRDTSLAPKVPERKNAAKKLARALYMKYPVLYGGQDHIDSVVTRWRGQLAENSKTLSSSHIFPEMNHNEIVGWENPKKLLKKFIVVVLRDGLDHPRTARRMDITKKIIEKEGVKVIEVRSSPGGLLSRVFSLVYTGDFASFYLAILNRRDPTPVERVTYLKKELFKVRG